MVFYPGKKTGKEPEKVAPKTKIKGNVKKAKAKK